MLKTVLLSLAAVLAAAVAIVLVLAARKPDSFGMSRSIVIATPPERIYPLIADLAAWTAWSPWERRDPNLQRSYGPATTGVGATYAWRGNNEVGEGKMAIVEARPAERVAVKLDFLKPFAASNDVVFALAPEAGGTRVTWSMSGPTPFLAKIVHVFMDMDRMVGRDFESGLSAMKQAAEAKS